jgi:NAD(P)-dependent dehydrogenase (short-subunit alcohol dehydrogenase family)
VITLGGKVALVTGASSGLGLRFAHALAEAGAWVAVAARRLDRIEALATEIGGAAFTLDVTDVTAIRAVTARVEQALGPIDILVNNAGISRQARAETVEEADYDAVMATNLKGPFFLAQAVARRMIALQRPGRIVNIASVGGLRPLGQLATYGMSKAGLIAMTKSMAREWGRHGINVNAICPGYIETEMAAEFLQTEAGEKFLRALPRRRMGEPRDLDALLLLLCAGEEGRFINGSIMTADDGFLVS